MKTLRKALLVSASFAVLAVPAFAQPKPQEVVATVPGRVATYHSAILGLSPVASATDFFTIIGSATMIVRVKEIECDGIASAASSIPLQLVKRSAADTTGTSSAPAVVPSDSNDVVGTAVVKAYTANPGALGTLLGVVRTGVLSTAPLATPALNAPTLRWQFGTNNEQEPTLRGVAQTLAINANAATFTSGAAIDCSVTWTESAN